MAKDKSADNVEVAQGEAATSKRGGPRGPRKEKPIYLLFHATDASGSPVEGVNLNIVLATKNAEALMEAMDKNPGAQRIRVG